MIVFRLNHISRVDVYTVRAVIYHSYCYYWKCFVLDHIVDSYDRVIWLFTLFWWKSFQAKTAFEADIDCVQEIADFYRFGVHYAKVTFCSKETIIPNPNSVYFVDFVVYQEIQ